MNITYGAYARLKGGNSGSSSYVHMFATFDMKNIENGTRVMEEILETLEKMVLPMKSLKQNVVIS